MGGADGRKLFLREDGVSVVQCRVYIEQYICEWDTSVNGDALCLCVQGE